uniref:BED-type domain-containing protein n=1 Tax=Nelumbo nucifera TaxID=4432 RepID=A0A822XIN5_NELNU|nr:TPA_asm: hypothetical protein HUJ06_020372 [Nelumbo nucifera]
MRDKSDNTQESNRKDPGWKYCYLQDPKNTNTGTCKFCGKVTNGGIYRAKDHLIAGRRNVKVCTKCPKEVKEKILAYMHRKKSMKEHMIGGQERRIPDFEYIIEDEDERWRVITFLVLVGM